jgi:hypothetical protein
MKDDSLVSTVSSTGTWLKSMGLSETASTAGRERDAKYVDEKYQCG